MTALCPKLSYNKMCYKGTALQTDSDISGSTVSAR